MRSRGRLPAAARGGLIAGPLGDELVEEGTLAFARAKDAPQALDVLAARGAPREDHGDVSLWHVHAFIQDVRGNDGTVAALAEAVQDLLAFAGRRLVCDTGYEEPGRERVDLIHALGEHDGTVLPVPLQEAIERSTLALGGGPDLTPASRRQKSLSSPRVARGRHHDESLLVLGGYHRE